MFCFSLNNMKAHESDITYKKLKRQKTLTLPKKMGRRYYCDYCDKTFIDDLEARRKHLTSSHHIKLRKLHYEQHRG